MADDDMPNVNKVVEMKLPLVWIIGTAFAVITSYAYNVSEVKQLIKVTEETRMSQLRLDERVSLLSNSGIETRGQINNLQMQLTRIDAEQSELRKEQSNLRQQQRWAPK